MNFKTRVAASLLAVAAMVLPGFSGAALLGVTPLDPKLDFSGSGVVDYSSTTNILTISGVPATLVRTSPFFFASVTGTGANNTRLFTVKVKVDPATGNFVGSAPGSQADIQIVGQVDLYGDGKTVYKGTLLTAKVTAVGSLPSALGAGTAAQFDVTGTVTDGSLTGGSTPIYAKGSPIVIQVSSEPSAEFPNPFTGSFTTSFRGPAKGLLGSGGAVVGRCKIEVNAQCSVAGSPLASKCRIDQYKSPMYWDYEARTSNGQSYQRYSYGLHGTQEPNWSIARSSEATPVTFDYVVKNKGDTTITGINLDDSFDTAVPPYPTTLAPGASFEVTFVKNLREALEDTVLVTGTSGSFQCRDSDTVVIKGKLRDRYRNDDDDFNDKGKDDPVDRQ